MLRCTGAASPLRWARSLETESVPELHFLPRLAAVLVGASLFAPAAVSAFTFEDGKGNSMPKFDLEEQTRQFRTRPDLDLSTDSKKGLTTPFGTLQFGVDRNGSAFSSPQGGISNANRQHYERMFSPSYIQGRGD